MAGVIIFGTHVFTKLKGYFGKPETCPICHAVYQKGYVSTMAWKHLYYIPVWCKKWVYMKQCPICGQGTEIDRKEARREMRETEGRSKQAFKVYAKHVLANKPAEVIAIDNSYELWVKDLTLNKEVCVATKLSKYNLQTIKTTRGLKEIPIINC